MSELIDDALTDLALLVRVADNGGFTAAARLTGIPQATVSRRIALLEKRFGTQLLHRTTRRVSLTQAGQRIYDYARLMLDQAEAAAAAVAALQSEPTGALRIVAPVILGQVFIGDIVADFMARYPKVSVKLELTGRQVDIVEESVDIAIRVGRVRDSALRLNHLGSASTGLYAAPQYLSASPEILNPADLSSHPVLSIGLSLDPKPLTLRCSNQLEVIPLQARMACNDTIPLKKAAIAGLGIAILPRFSVADELVSGELVEVLPEWKTPTATVSALTLSSRGALPIVRLFLEAMQHQLQEQLI